MLQHFKHHQFFYIFIPYYEKDKRFKSERNFEILKKKKTHENPKNTSQFRQLIFVLVAPFNSIALP